MRVVIIGAGVTGLATAYYLNRDGHEVSVIDAHEGPGLGASYANGAQLSYSYVAPLAGPGVLPKVPPWLLRADAPLRFQPRLDPDQWRWLIAFVLACTARQSNETTRHLLALSFHSRAMMHALVETPEGAAIDFGHATNGKLVVFSKASEFEGAQARIDYQRSLGCEQQALDRDACHALEPALSGEAVLGRRMVGAIYTPSEEVGDCYAFCVGLERLLREKGVAFRYGANVTSVERGADGSVTGVMIDGMRETVGCVVLASGTGSVALARKLGLYLPIYPLKGYSISPPAGPGAPAISITDAERKIVYAPLQAQGNRAARVRIAGMADIVGHDARPDPVRVAQLVTEARAAFPDATSGDYAPETLDVWAGLRPATPLGTPLLGKSPVPGLYLNVGHGALGWTLALGSGQVVADCIAGRAPTIPMEGLVLT